ncbi:unnamed protein product [Didymodactylos carnosus]|uniref:G domain-containing protein n=1 Tax=Didymodactylos carnosus TaxID=1234261 RepID=A0A814Z7D1_9BILA|nr:unnamed protein product [Didymodactylos carnosus]CAF4001996.1 unnamed protein product [Didymodactylos carnosus]
MTKAQMTSTSKLKRFIVLGDAGAGKSSFINFLYNYYHGTKKSSEIFCEHPQVKLAIPCANWLDCLDEAYKNNNSEHNINDQTKSQTQICTTYIIHRKTSCLEIIDTPGFNDTNGADVDEKNLTLIEKALKEVSFLNGIILVVNGAVPRLGVSFKNFLHMLHQVWPNNLLNNCVAILTNCDELSVNLDSSVLKRDLNVDDSKKFHLQNSLFRWDPKKRSPKTIHRFQQDFEDNLDTIKSLVQKLSEFHEVSTISFEVGAIKIALIEKCVFQSIQNMVDLLEKYKEQQVAQAGIEGARDTMQNNKEWDKHREINAVRWVEAPRRRSPSPSRLQQFSSVGAECVSSKKPTELLSNKPQYLLSNEGKQTSLDEAEQILGMERRKTAELTFPPKDHDLRISKSCNGCQVDDTYLNKHNDQALDDSTVTVDRKHDKETAQVDILSLGFGTGSHQQYNPTTSEKKYSPPSLHNFSSNQQSLIVPYCSTPDGSHTLALANEKHYHHDSSAERNDDSQQRVTYPVPSLNNHYDTFGYPGDYGHCSLQAVYQQEQTKIQVTLPDNEARSHHKYAQEQESKLQVRRQDLVNEQQLLMSSMTSLLEQLKKQVAELRSINKNYNIIERNRNVLILFRDEIKYMGDGPEMLRYYNDTAAILSN